MLLKKEFLEKKLSPLKNTRNILKSLKFFLSQSWAEWDNDSLQSNAFF